MGNTLHAYKHVQGIYFPIAVAVFAIVLGTLAILLVRGARRSRAGRRSEAQRFEVGYALVLACVAAFLLWVTFTAETPIDRTAAHPALRLKVVAAQWSWRFVYPGGVSVTAVNTWHPTPAFVPAGRVLEIAGTSEDVIHGFWVPGIHYQRQMLPGYTTRFDLLFQKTGYYEGACSVLCGQDHSEMHFAIRAVSPRQFGEWLARQPRGGAT